MTKYSLARTLSFLLVVFCLLSFGVAAPAEAEMVLATLLVRVVKACLSSEILLCCRPIGVSFCPARYALSAGIPTKRLTDMLQAVPNLGLADCRDPNMNAPIIGVKKF